MTPEQERMEKLAELSVSKERSRGSLLDESLTVPTPLFLKKNKSEVYPSSKRILDLVLTLCFTLISLPVFGLVALAIKATSRGSVFHKQVRVGTLGKQFVMCKFRTMVLNAEEMFVDVKHLNEVDGKIFKMRDDPRVTAVGRFLRKSSLDELPQLFNVLKGDMSLVGNRPPLPIEVKDYSQKEWLRLNGVPGITGLWQVSGRSKLSFSKMVELDVRYHNTRSLLLDLLILAKTIPAVIRGDGAY